MAITKKKVNIYPTTPITTVNPTIRTTVLGQEMSLPEIRACLLRQAKVEEILSDGTKVPLDLHSIDLDNEKIMAKKRAEEEAKIARANGLKDELKKAQSKITELEALVASKEKEIVSIKTKLEATNNALDKANKEIANAKSNNNSKNNK